MNYGKCIIYNLVILVMNIPLYKLNQLMSNNVSCPCTDFYAIGPFHDKCHGYLHIASASPQPGQAQGLQSHIRSPLWLCYGQ